MPPEQRFNKRDIVDCALNIVREKGMEGVTARSVAKELGCSVKPIFSCFENMAELTSEVKRQAWGVYKHYLEEDMSAGKYPEYKAAGMAYIRFAREEKELFKLLFMAERSASEFSVGDDWQPVTQKLKDKTGLDQAAADSFHFKMWVFVHGIASMAATGFLRLDEQEISGLLTEVFTGMIKSKGQEE